MAWVQVTAMAWEQEMAVSQVQARPLKRSRIHHRRPLTRKEMIHLF